MTSEQASERIVIRRGGGRLGGMMGRAAGFFRPILAPVAAVLGGAIGAVKWLWRRWWGKVILVLLSGVSPGFDLPATIAVYLVAFLTLGSGIDYVYRSNRMVSAP